MLKVVLYCHQVNSISGVHTWEANFINALKQYCEITYVYRTAKVDRLSKMKEIVECIEYNGQEIECDVCIYTSTRRHQPKIKAKHYLQILHGHTKKLHPSYVPENNITHIAVSQTVRKQFKADYNLDSLVIDNIIQTPKVDRVVRFITCSRVSEEKGFERVIKMARSMKEQGYKFVWEVYGGASGESKIYLEHLKQQTKDIPEIAWMGYRIDPQSYMAGCNYLVQLSDHEGFCYSIHEALALGVPVIVTDWQGVREVVKDGKNGYILDMELSNLDIQRIFTNQLQGYFISKSDSVAKWLELFKSYEKE